MSNKVFFLGDVALDEYYQAPRFPKIKEKIIVQTLPTQMGGMIANAACVFATYNKNAAFLAALNTGSISQKLCEGLKEAGLDTKYIIWDDTLPDSKTIIILANGEHTVFIPAMNLQSFELSSEALHEICSSNYLYSNFCELRPLRYKEQNAIQVLEKAKSCGCKLWCDLDVADFLDDDDIFFNYTDTIFVNELGFSNLNKRFDSNALKVLFQKGVHMIIVTRAENGCVVYRPNQKEISLPGIHVPVVDVTGAGDTFCSSFLFAHTCTDNIKICAEFANYAAARSIMIMGARAGSAGVDMVLKFIKSQGDDISRFACIKNYEEAQP